MKTTKVELRDNADGINTDIAYTAEREEEEPRPRSGENRGDRWYWGGMECRRAFQR